MKWTDTIRIAEELHDKFPDIDPLTVRFTDGCANWTSLMTIRDDPERSFWKQFRRHGSTRRNSTSPYAQRTGCPHWPVRGNSIINRNPHRQGRTVTRFALDSEFAAQCEEALPDSDQAEYIRLSAAVGINADAVVLHPQE